MIKIFLTSAITVLTGTVVYVFGRLIEKFFIDPIHAQNEVIEDIAGDLIYFAHFYTNPLQPGLPGDGQMLEQKYRDASEKIRKNSTFLIARTNSIPMYDFLTCLNFRIPKQNIKEAASLLIGISNSFFRTQELSQGFRNSESADKVRKLLNLDTVH